MKTKAGDTYRTLDGFYCISLFGNGALQDTVETFDNMIIWINNDLNIELDVDWYTAYSSDYSFSVCFRKESDCVAFKLRWS